MVVLTAFALQAAWVAVSARLVIYDEGYHIEAIEAFSTRLTPFIDQVPGDGAIGDAERYGSWLYHYLMSWPWRLMRGMGLDVGDRTVALRLLTVVIVTAALAVFHRLARALGASRAVATVAIAVVATSPLLVFLAGAVSYDNLQLLMAAGFFVVAVRVWRATSLDLVGWLGIVALGTFGALTKYTLLPVLAVIGVALIVRQARYARELPRHLRVYLSRARARRIALALASVLGVALFIERYVINLVRYGSPTPACERVHELEICQMFGPWARNVELYDAFTSVPASLNGMVDFGTYHWLPAMLRYTTLIGVVDQDARSTATLGPHAVGPIVLAFLGALAVVLILGWGVVRGIAGARLLLAASAFLTAVLFWQNYTDYRTLGVGVGIAARYLLVVYPVVVVIACIVVSRLASAGGAGAGRKVKLALVLGLVLSATQGGGVLSYLWSVQPDWLRNPDGIVGSVTLSGHEVARAIVLPNEIVRDPRLG
ncbi:MAG: hypothetical protein ACTMIR_05000 [Cellulomonadaceae bacterium]